MSQVVHTRPLRLEQPICLLLLLLLQFTPQSLMHPRRDAAAAAFVLL